MILDFLINQVSLFKLLSDKQLKTIVTGSRVQSYGFNEAVVKFGEDATFYGVLIARVRVLGPVRNATQVEIAMTEQFKLGIHPPIRESGDLEDTPGCTLESPSGKIKIKQGVICALRHIHMTPADALRYGVKDRSVVKVRVSGDRELIFGDVLIRVNPDYNLAMHIDTDEANAANVKTGAMVFIQGVQNLD